jgi:[CysO sulfur-carrier protein]-S-L-cysteine hydrolase
MAYDDTAPRSGLPGLQPLIQCLIRDTTMTTDLPPLALPRTLVNRILTQAQQQPETETCGLLGARNGDALHYYPVRNVAADTATRFEMDPQQQIRVMKALRENDEQLLAIVHSHPHSPPAPSAADMEGFGYPDAYYLIVSLNVKGVLEMRGYRRVNDCMQRIDLLYEHGAKD